MENPIQVNKQIEEFLSLQDFWLLCRSHYKWFAVSVGAFLMIAVFYLSTTADIYTREAAVMVKMETTRGTVTPTTHGNDFNNMALVQQQTNVPNVLRQYTSLSLLTEVACHLGSITDTDRAQRVAQGIQGALTVSLDDDVYFLAALSRLGHIDNVVNGGSDIEFIFNKLHFARFYL